ncbi:MAG: hypothetical protein ABI333_29550 [bacterium]
MIVRIGTSVFALAVAVALCAGCTKKKATPANRDAKLDTMRPGPMKAKPDQPKPRKRVTTPPRRTAPAGGTSSGLVGKKVAVNLYHSAWKYHDPQYHGNVVSVDDIGLLLSCTKYYQKMSSNFKKSTATLYIPWTSIRSVLLLKK